MKKNHIIAYIISIPQSAIESILQYGKEKKNVPRIMLIRDSKSRGLKSVSEYEQVDIIIDVDFSKPNKIAEALMPYQDELAAITCRSDASIAKFAAVIPHVPYLRTPTTESLKWATNKLKMRRRLTLFDRKNTPRYTIVKNGTKTECKRIGDKIGFPLIVKPANLAMSMLVSICYHEEELEKTLRSTFRKIKRVYNENERNEPPQVLAEEYMEGDMYSVDGYVNSRGTVTFCPMVRVITGRNIGHDDFFNYLHMTPTSLKKATVERAHRVAETGIHALGLRNTTVHAELMKVDDEWKIIEIGPRIGGFRHKLHELSCDINHSLNDILIRIPKPVVVPKKCKGYAATMKWFPKKEGIITRLKGIKKIRELRSFIGIVVSKKVGDRCHFAKNGGKAVFTMTLYNKERSKLLADIRRVEQLVDIKIK